MANKMGNTLVALCSVALGAIYTTGYVVTKSPDVSAMAPPSGNGPATSQHTESHTTSKPSTPSTSTTNSTTAPAKPKTTSNQKWLDGTYQGSGSNRIGTVYVAVTIQGGKISKVDITECDTHYPQSYIDPVLPQEVVQRQSPNVDIVSGATLSTYNFAYAVQEALTKAQNPNYVAGT
ncbi:FMN-binding protein [Alicyclobacillus dauci]|uniref:FMN-binding protein n=1 Tax=Alicyclobacillus dauci TaxID=1475485 RepID=A0ABY6Z3Z6_9BACL|nr:FMN-binding protein [Alicyclobacillus dauci]WAH37609.1 FMN-binding protein [Alicyclobacillus dauci]